MIPVAPLQSPHPPWVHLFITDEYEAGESLPHDLPRFQIIHLDGQRCETKQQLFTEYARAFEFPNYFGENWDALEECLSDLEWKPSKGYLTLLHHGERILSKQEEEYSTFVTILKSIGKEWSCCQEDSSLTPPIPFHTLFLVSSQHYDDRHDWQLPLLFPPTP